MCRDSAVMVSRCISICCEAYVYFDLHYNITYITIMGWLAWGMGKSSSSSVSGGGGLGGVLSWGSGGRGGTPPAIHHNMCEYTPIYGCFIIDNIKLIEPVGEL